MVITALAILVVLLGLNAFFALAEFAVVRVRASKVVELVKSGDARAVALQGIRERIDEYLSVVQVGITCAGIGLGFVLDAGISEPIQRVMPGDGTLNRALSLAIAFCIGTFLSVVLGELVPKALAIRDTETMALRCAKPLRFFHRIFWLPLKALSISSRLVLRLLGYRDDPAEPAHSEDELRLIIGESQEGGMMSFRRLLMVENVFDFGELVVRDAMRPRRQAQVLALGMPRDAVAAAVREHRFSRWPLVDPRTPDEMPLGVVHVKDLFCGDPTRPDAWDLRSLARPYLTFREDMPLEQALAEFQRRHRHLAMITDAAGRWTGFLTLEDVVEDIVGQIHDEFEREPTELADTFSAKRMLVDVPARSIEEITQRLVELIAPGDLPAGVTRERLLGALRDRERSMATYVGRGIAIPHARVDGLIRPLLAVARIREGIPVPGGEERARLVFLVLTPAGDPRLHIRLLSRIASLVESDYVMERLVDAEDPQELAEAIAEGSRIASS